MGRGGEDSTVRVWDVSDFVGSTLRLSTSAPPTVAPPASTTAPLDAAAIVARFNAVGQDAASVVVEQTAIFTTRGLQLDLNLNCQIYIAEGLYCAADADVQMGSVSESGTFEMLVRDERYWDREDGGPWKESPIEEGKLDTLADEFLFQTAAQAMWESPELVEENATLDGERVHILSFVPAPAALNVMGASEITTELKSAAARGQFESAGKAWFSVEDGLIRRMEIDATFPIEGQSMTVHTDARYAFDVPVSIPVVE